MHLNALVKTETTLQWLKRIGSKKALLERQRLREAGEINQPIERKIINLRSCLYPTHPKGK